ncbi:MAG: family 16 glycoside hydrolase, partial [Chloroflexota bacterium]
TEFPATAKILTVPTYNWVFGCSAVSGAMIAGYYDRNGYPNMYTGPTASGVMPLTDTSWPTWNDGYETYPNNPLVASHQGVDGRTIKGSIDDYWVKYQSTLKDPYITGGWTRHTWESAIGDYMKTSQSAYTNKDGSTRFFNYTDSASKLTCAVMVTNNVFMKDGTYGIKLFYEKKGYSVTDCYSQQTDNKIAGGFSLADFKAEINAGHPVMLHLAGHSIVGVGYRGSTPTDKLIYIHDTWHSSGDQTMTWGGSYSGMVLESVSIVTLQSAPVVVPTPKTPSGTITVTKPKYTWTKIANATKYQYQIRKGTTTIFTSPDILTSNCTNTTCSHTPNKVLDYAAHSWRVHAYVGGKWQSWSAYKNFTVVQPSTGFNSQFNGEYIGWEKHPGGTWRINSTTFYNSGAVTNKYSSSSYNKNFTDFTYEARIKDAEYYLNGLIIRGNPTFNATDNSWKNGYYFLIDQNGKFGIFKKVNDLWNASPSDGWQDATNIIKGGWNTLKAVVNGNNLKFYINDSLVFNGSDSRFSSGRVGLIFYRSSTLNRYSANWAKLTPITASAGSISEEPVLSGQGDGSWDPLDRFPFP